MMMVMMMMMMMMIIIIRFCSLLFGVFVHVIKKIH